MVSRVQAALGLVASLTLPQLSCSPIQTAYAASTAQGGFDDPAIEDIEIVSSDFRNPPVSPRRLLRVVSSRLWSVRTDEVCFRPEQTDTPVGVEGVVRVYCLPAGHRYLVRLKQPLDIHWVRLGKNVTAARFDDAKGKRALYDKRCGQDQFYQKDFKLRGVFELSVPESDC